MSARPHPLMPSVPILPGMSLEDHVAYVVSATAFEEFACHWLSQGYVQLPALESVKYPARHIGFIHPNKPDQPMVALSVSEDEASPINRFIQLYGSHRLANSGEILVGTVQHIAYKVDPAVTSIEAVREELIRRGVQFMTPIVTYSPNPASLLKQTFVGCLYPWGPFVELVQRTDLPVAVTTGRELSQGFDPTQIDTLYDYYHRYSLSLIGG